MFAAYILCFFAIFWSNLIYGCDCCCCGKLRKYGALHNRNRDLKWFKSNSTSLLIRPRNRVALRRLKTITNPCGTFKIRFTIRRYLCCSMANTFVAVGIGTNTQVGRRQTVVSVDRVVAAVSPWAGSAKAIRAAEKGPTLTLARQGIACAGARALHQIFSRALVVAADDDITSIQVRVIRDQQRHVAQHRQEVYMKWVRSAHC